MPPRPSTGSNPTSPPLSGAANPTAIRLMAAFAVTLISFSAVFYRLASVSPSTAAFFRAIYALPFLFVLWRMTANGRPRSSRDRGWAMLAGVFLGFDLYVWHHAIEVIGVGLATVLGNTQVIFVALLGWLIYREKPTRAAMLLTPVILLGIAMLSGLGGEDAYGSNPQLGVWLGLLTGVLYSIFLLLMRHANRGGASGVGALFDATLGTAVAMFGVGWVEGNLDWTPHWPAHGWLLALALVSQVVGWWIITSSLPKLPALQTSILLLLQPMGSVLWGWLLFAERLSQVQGFGAVLVLVGVATVTALGTVRASPDKERSTGIEESSSSG